MLLFLHEVDHFVQFGHRRHPAPGRRSEVSPLVGRQLAKVGLPDTARALLVRRYGTYLVPTGGTRLRRGDVLLLLVDEEAEAALDTRTDLERAPGPVAVCRIDQSPGPGVPGDSAHD